MRLKQLIFIILLFTTISYRSFSSIIVERGILIKENSDFIISNVSNIDCSIEGNEFLICCGETGIAVIDFETGVEKYKIQPDSNYYDLFIDNLNNEQNLDSRYFFYPTFKEIADFVPAYLSYLKLDFTRAHYSNRDKKIDVLSKVMSISQSKIDSSFRGGNRVTMFTISDSVDNIVFKGHPKDKYPSGFDFVENNEILYIPSFDLNQYIEEKNFDSLSVLTSYDANGNFINVCHYSPLIYQKSKLGYALSDLELHLCSTGDDVYILHKYIDFIENVGNNTQIKLIGLPYPNDTALCKLGKLFEEANYNVMEVPNDKYVHYLPIRNLQLINYNDNLCVCAGEYIYSNNWFKQVKVHLQVYSTSGKLLKQVSLESENHNGEFKKVAYNQAKDKFLILRKSKTKGWTMEVAKWEN